MDASSHRVDVRMDSVNVQSDRLSSTPSTGYDDTSDTSSGRSSDRRSSHCSSSDASLSDYDDKSQVPADSAR